MNQVEAGARALARIEHCDWNILSVDARKYYYDRARAVLDGAALIEPEPASRLEMEAVARVLSISDLGADMWKRLDSVSHERWINRVRVVLEAYAQARKGVPPTAASSTVSGPAGTFGAVNEPRTEPPPVWSKHQFHWLCSERADPSPVAEWIDGRWHSQGETIFPEEMYRRGWRWLAPAIPPATPQGIPHPFS